MIQYVRFGVQHGARRRGSELEQGMGIKSALILNYSRDKNSCPKRSVGDYGSPSSLVQTF